MISFNRRVARILEEGGFVEAALLKDATTEAASNGRSVTTVLLDKRAMSEPDLLGVLASSLGVPPVDLDKVEFSPDVGEWLPEDLARKGFCVALSKMGGLLTVAVANPYDVVKHDDLRLATGCDLRLALALEPQIQRAITKIYHSGEAELSDLLEEAQDPELAIKEGTPEDDVVDLAAIAEGEEAPVIKLVNLITYDDALSHSGDVEDLKRTFARS